jgi:uncharacterized OB-fold protein
MDVPLPARGMLTSYTKVWIPRDDYPSPFLLGQVVLDDGTLLFSHVCRLPENQLVPTRVAVVVPHQLTDGLAFWFEPDPSLS